MSMVLDFTMIEQLKALMEDDFWLLINTFIDDGDNRIKQLEAAFQASDQQQIMEIAHSLKGSSSNLGATILSDLCYQLQTQALEKSMADLAHFLPEVKQAYLEVRTELLKIV